MKTKTKKIIFMVLTILSCLFISTSVQAAAKKVKLIPNRTYKYDVTGDGKKDSLKLKTTTLKDYQKHLTVYVNGKVAYQIKSTSEYDIYDYYTELLVLENNKSFLFLSGEGVSGTVYSEILQYRQGKMKRIINFAKMYGSSAVRGCATRLTVNKNKITVDCFNVSYIMGTMSTQRSYIYKDGTLKRTSSVDEFISARKVYTARRTIRLYEKTGSSGKYITVKKGQKITLDKVRMYQNKCYFRGKINGKYGWFTLKWKKYMDYQNRLFEEVMFAG